MSSACRECRDELDHCHGTVVHHVRFRVECTENCATPDALHSFRVDCDAIGCVCTVTISASAAS